MTFRRSLLLGGALLLAVVAATAAGCGFFSSDGESLPGVYASNKFRVQTTGGDIIDVGGHGAALGMTLTGDGRVARGHLTVPAGVAPGSCADPRTDASFTGTYERHGKRVTFDFDGDALSDDCFGTGTPLGETAWNFYESDGILRTDADAYVIFLEKEGEVKAE